jgi:biotin transport system substrate-specific component
VSTGVRSMTLADAVLPGRRGLSRDIFLVLAFAALMPLLARIAVPLPFTPVPITGQTFGVLLAGALLGPRRGALALLVYLAEGLAGLPVFAGGASAWSPSRAGVPVIVGPSAGYLLSYPIAAFAVGVLAARGWDRRFWRAAAAMLVGEVVIYLVGLPWLGAYVGMERAVPLGLLPFVPGDALKLLLAAALLPAAWRLLGTTDPFWPGPRSAAAGTGRWRR